MPKQTILRNSRGLTMFASCILSFIALAVVIPLTAQGRPEEGGVIITPMASALSVDPGNAITHSFTVKNNTGVLEVFTLTATADQWLPQIEVNGVVTDQLALFNGTSGEVALVVFVPSNAVPFASGHAAFTVTAHSDTAISATVLLTTSRNTYDVEFGAVDAAQSADPGASVLYTLQVTNTGNITDTFYLTQTSLWAASLPSSIGPLAANLSANALVTVTIPITVGGNLTGYTQITVTSQADPSQQATAMLATTANTLAGVALTPTANARSDYPGQNVTYTVYLSNTGNTSDSFSLANSNSVWPVSMPSSVGPVPSHQNTAVTISVDILSNAVGGENHTVAVTATSTLSPSKKASAQLTTTALPVSGVALAPVAQSKTGDPSQVVAYTLWVTNTGNTMDSFTITAHSRYSISLPLSLESLPRGQSAVLLASVTIPGEAPANDMDMAVITVTSHMDPTKFKTATLTTTARDIYSFTLTTPTTMQTASPGDLVHYPVHIVNQGNASDVLSLTVTSDSWTTTVNGSPTSLITLGISASQDVTVVVSVPSTASENAFDVATLIATSGHRPTLATTIVFTTTRRTVKVYLPLVLRNWPPPPPDWMPGASDLSSETVYQIAVCQKDTTRLYAATRTKGVYVSTNAGTSWSASGLGNVLVRGVAVNAQDCNVAYAFAWGEGVKKTIDGGTTWVSVNKGLGELYGYSVLVDPSQPQTVYAGTDAYGVYKSTDGGANWSPTAIAGVAVLGLSLKSDGALYAATFGAGVYRLVGNTAVRLSDLNLSATANVFAIAASPTTLFAAAETGLYRSQDNGTTWQVVLSGKGRVFSVVIDATTASSTVWAGVESYGVWRSLDDGATFTSYSQGLTSGLAVRNVAIGATRLYAGTVSSGAWWVPYP
jgi:uncharacterized membrane protein